ncbi:hypothetical protein BJ170DRAFT_599967 [Xylariales sp. AK1849]|nr:hypothetical protein BJ170DRAFT_599967 [Xylariales sp. AK1849]
MAGELNGSLPEDIPSPSLLPALAFRLFDLEVVGEGSEALQVFNPVAVPSGKRVAFFWNGKPGGDVALRRAEEQLLRLFPDLVTKQLHWEHHRGGGVIPLDQVVPFQPDVLVASTADCAVAVGAAADLVALERLGIPTVIITATHFIDSLQYRARFSGLIQPLLVAEVPDPFTNISPEKIIEHTDAALDQIMAGLVTQATGFQAGHQYNHTGRGAYSNVVTYRAGSPWDILDMVNKSFLDYGIGDGLPIIPPTPKRVSAMMAGVAMPPNTEIALLGLGKGSATVHKIAINAVMAGCDPTHLSVVIAAVRAVSHPRFPLDGLAGSTTAHSTMLIINGPVAKELKFNDGVCCLGPSARSHVNIVIGRAIRLIQLNIAFQYTGITDLDYFGAGNKFSLCFAESESANPWEPLHVERGFSRNVSTVSAVAVDSQSEGRSASPKPELILRAIAGAIATPTTTGSTIWMDAEVSNAPVVVLSSTHAKALAEAGWSKRDVKQFLYQHSRVPAFYFKFGSSRNGEQLAKPWQWLNSAP